MADRASLSARRIEDVVCPFCGLGCDDLVVEVDGAEIRALTPACGGARELFRRDRTHTAMPQLAGEECSLEAAAMRAAELFGSSQSTLIAGLGADVAGLRSVLALAEAGGGIVDHYASAGLFRALATAQRTGWLTTTIAEVRQRCDLLLVVGTDPTETFERLFERLLPQQPGFASSAQRQVVFLGGAPSEAASEQLRAFAVTSLPGPSDALVDLLLLLNRLLEGGNVQGGSAGGIELDVVKALAEALSAARYTVVAFDAGNFPNADADLLVETAAQLVDRLNETTRAALLPLGGRDNVVGAHQVALWRTGFPLRTAVRRGAADHDPFLFHADAARRDCDVMIWISAFRPEPPPPFGGPVVALAHPKTSFQAPPDVFIPVATPGIDHDGHVFRMDTVVCLPLKKLRQPDMPSVSQAASAIADAWRREHGG